MFEVGDHVKVSKFFFDRHKDFFDTRPPKIIKMWRDKVMIITSIKMSSDGNLKYVVDSEKNTFWHQEELVREIRKPLTFREFAK